MRRLNRPASFLVFVALGALWLASFRMADALTFFKTYSSIWFLPAGVTMAIVMVAPGWLKLAPLAANLLLASPSLRAGMGVSVVNDYEPLLHGVRLFLVYGGAGYALTHLAKVAVPATSLRDYQWITATTIAAVSIATASGIFMHMLAGNMTLAEAQEVAWSWWLGDAIGAFAVPPLLVPLLVHGLGGAPAGWHWPGWRAWLAAVAVILLVFLAGVAVFQGSDGVFRIWHVLLVPPMLFALRGGLPMSALCVFLTIVLVPPLVALFSLQHQLVDIVPLLLTTSIAGLLLGAALSDRQKVLNEVEQRVAERTRALSEAHEFQRHLIRSIGHDMRQPIDGMNMVLEGLDRSPDAPESQAAIRHARQIGALASQLLSTILTYARFDAGRLEIQAAEFPVAALFDRLSNLFTPFAALKQVELVWHHQGEVLQSDENLLGQALSNLIDNAIRLSEPGARVDICVEPTADEIAILVVDRVAPLSNAPGAAGFGLDIVAKIATVLGARLVSEPHRRGLALPRHRRG